VLPFYLSGTVSNDNDGNVVLTLARNTAAPALSANQQGLAALLETSHGASLTATSLAGAFQAATNAAQLQQGLDITSGDALTALPLASQETARRFGARLRSRNMDTFTRDTMQAALNEQARAPRLVYSGTRYGSLLAAAPAETSATTATRQSAKVRSNFWGGLGYGKDETDSDGNGPGYDARSTEFQVGYDRLVGKSALLGVALGSSNGKVNVSARGARADLDTTSLGVYARQENEALYWNAALSYNRHKIDSRRNLLLGGVAQSDSRARTLEAQGEVGKRFGKGAYSIEPNLTLSLANTRLDGFTETGPVGALSVDADNYNSRRVGLGVRAVSRAGNTRLVPHAALSFEREFGDTRATLNNQLAGVGAFGVSSPRLGRNILSARLGAEARVNNQISFSGEIGAAWRQNQNVRSVAGSIQYRW
jgi:outer membrane autotransporter protein